MNDETTKRPDVIAPILPGAVAYSEERSLRKVQEWFDNVNRALPDGITIVPGPNYPAGVPRPLPTEVSDLLRQADAALEKSRDLLRRARRFIAKHPVGDDAHALYAEICDLLGD